MIFRKTADREVRQPIVPSTLQGAAYGIAGIIKGLGILSLKQLDVMGKLTEAIQEKKNYKYREGNIYKAVLQYCKLNWFFEIL